MSVSLVIVHFVFTLISFCFEGGGWGAVRILGFTFSDVGLLRFSFEL